MGSRKDGIPQGRRAQGGVLAFICQEAIASTPPTIPTSNPAEGSLRVSSAQAYARTPRQQLDARVTTTAIAGLTKEHAPHSGDYGHH